MTGVENILYAALAGAVLGNLGNGIREVLVFRKNTTLKTDRDEDWQAVANLNTDLKKLEHEAYDYWSNDQISALEKMKALEGSIKFLLNSIEKYVEHLKQSGIDVADEYLLLKRLITGGAFENSERVKDKNISDIQLFNFSNKLSGHLSKIYAKKYRSS